MSIEDKILQGLRAKELQGGLTKDDEALRDSLERKVKKQKEDLITAQEQQHSLDLAAKQKELEDAGLALDSFRGSESDKTIRSFVSGERKIESTQDVTELDNALGEYNELILSKPILLESPESLPYTRLELYELGGKIKDSGVSTDGSTNVKKLLEVHTKYENAIKDYGPEKFQAIDAKEKEKILNSFETDGKINGNGILTLGDATKKDAGLLPPEVQKQGQGAGQSTGVKIQ